MLKAEFIKELKQTSVSENAEKTKERLRVLWSPLASEKREEILAFTGLNKSAIQRAYKTGSASAKIIAAVSQVLGVDPYYIAGKSDEQRPFDDALLIQFLKELNYEVGKGDILKRRKTKQKSDTPVAPAPSETSSATSAANEITEEISGENETTAAENVATPSLRTSNEQIDLSTIANDVSKLDKKSLEKLNELSEDALILMLKSLTVQAGFSEYKKDRLALVKYLLLT